MKNTFDKDLKQRLDNASLQEAGLHFDKDKLWGKIEKKKKGKSIRFIPWMSHAAAVAAGLAIGIFFFTRKADETSESATAVLKPSLNPVTTTVHDTVYLVKTNEEQHHKLNQPETKINKSIQKKARPAIVVQQQQSKTNLKESILPQTNKPKNPEHAPEAIFVATSPKRVKVLHLSDMDNENTPATISVKRKPMPIFVISKNLPSEPNTETLSMLVVKTFSNSKK